MQLNERALEMQNAILLAVHKTDDIEEAERKELQVGCIFATADGKETLYDVLVEDKTEFGKVVFKRLGTKYGEEFQSVEDNEELGSTSIRIAEDIVENFEGLFLYVDEIIGLPPTLDRVLTALPKHYYYFVGGIFDYVKRSTKVCPRKLLNDDGTPCNLRQQDQSTQDALYPLLVK